jgi:4-carboxymuconolactone decarboxylase
MTDEPTTAREHFGDLAPTFAAITDKVLFGEVWIDPALSPRDRSLITVAALITAGRSEELYWHMKRAMDNRVTREELVAAITHLAFYAGWPNANGALNVIRRLVDQGPSAADAPGNVT